MGTNVKKTKMMVKSENAGKLAMGKFFCVVSRKGLGTSFEGVGRMRVLVVLEVN